MIIAISGFPGSGKTSVGKILAEKLGYAFYSMGDLRGKMAVEKGLTINELNALGEEEAFTDTSVDEYQKKLGETEDRFIVDGRLSWFFIPHAYKILLTCEQNEAARRILHAMGRDDEPEYSGLAETKKIIAERVASDVRRYQKYYRVDYRDPSHYDLVLDTTKNAGPEQTVEQILERMKVT